ncbi:MAG TPA: MFS transporter [Candidatus Limnocylindria bacterium]|nr:MFS transporter [Candidatus Limnocylindria bacterium]
MNRSITAVLVGTFTLRLSTGLTGTLLFYYLADLPRHGGPSVSAFMVGLLTAAYFVAELVLSPGFGVLSDRLGAHRVMQWGPVFGAVAVVFTGLSASIPILALTRLLEGAAGAASIPSILGYIALSTSADEQLRGRTVARFEAATLAGIGVGVVLAGVLYDLIGRNAFFLNAGIYAGSYLIYRYGVADLSPELLEQAAETRGSRFDVARYLRVLSSPSVWLLAPTWIALNAVVGAWTTQSVFQLVNEPNPAFAGQLLMGGLEPSQVSVSMGVALLVFFAGLFYWGNRFKKFRRTTIIGIGVGGGLVMMLAVFALNHSQDWGPAAQVVFALALAAGLFVLAGATPAALGLLADISETHPADRGVIMGLYSVFLALGQIVGALVSGKAAEWQGIDGLLLASLGLLLIALLPLNRLRASEHLVGAAPGEPPRMGAEALPGG